MQLPFFGKKIKNSARFLAATITADYVRVLAVYKDNGDLKVIGSGKEKMDSGKVRSGAIIFSEQVEDALESAVNQALTDQSEDISDIVIGVSGDLCVGFLTNLKIKRNKQTPINKSDIDQIYEKIDAVADIQAQNELLQINGNPNVTLERVLRTDIFIKADGENTRKLLNKTPTNIEISTFNAYVPSYHLETLKDVAENCGLRITSIAPEMFCLSQTCLKEQEDAVLIEIDGDYTHAAVVFSGGIVSTRTLNIGYRHFVEGISERMGLTMTEAARVLNTYLKGNLSASETTIVQNSLKMPVEIWLTGMELLFAEFSGVKTFPSKIYLTGEGVDLTDLWHPLVNEGWTKSIPFKSPPEFTKITFADVDKISDATGSVASSEWVPTVCSAIIKLEEGKDD